MITSQYLGILVHDIGAWDYGSHDEPKLVDLQPGEETRAVALVHLGYGKYREILNNTGEFPRFTHFRS